MFACVFYECIYVSVCVCVWHVYDIVAWIWWCMIYIEKKGKEKDLIETNQPVQIINREQSACGSSRSFPWQERAVLAKGALAGIALSNPNVGFVPAECPTHACECVRGYTLFSLLNFPNHEYHKFMFRHLLHTYSKSVTYSFTHITEHDYKTTFLYRMWDRNVIIPSP